jgi:hypothetical protein
VWRLDSKSDVSGKVMISTPFKSARSMYALYSKTGPMKNMNIHFETGINQQKITVDATHSADGVEIITFPETSDLLSICASTTITFFPYETCNLALLLNMVPSCSMEASIFGAPNAFTDAVPKVVPLCLKSRFASLCSTRREVLLISHSTL